MEREDTKAVMKTLRGLMKEKKLRYRDVGEHLGVAEVTIKRFMHDPDPELGRLSEVCDLVGISVFELFDLARRSLERPLQFTEAQNEFLAKRPYLIAYYFNLVRKQMTPDQIADEYGLTARSTSRYLTELEQCGLIKVDNDGGLRVTTHTRWYCEWDDRSPLGQVYGSLVANKFAERVKDGLMHKDHFCFDTGSCQLEESDIQSLQSDFEQLVLKYQSIGQRNVIKGNQGAKPFTWLWLGDFWRDPFYWQVENL